MTVNGALFTNNWVIPLSSERATLLFFSVALSFHTSLSTIKLVPLAATRSRFAISPYLLVAVATLRILHYGWYGTILLLESIERFSKVHILIDVLQKRYFKRGVFTSLECSN